MSCCGNDAYSKDGDDIEDEEDDDDNESDSDGEEERVVDDDVADKYSLILLCFSPRVRYELGLMVKMVVWFLERLD